MVFPKLSRLENGFHTFPKSQVPYHVFIQTGLYAVKYYDVHYVTLRRKLIKSLSIIEFKFTDGKRLVVVRDIGSVLTDTSRCFEQALYAFGIACAQWYAFSDHVSLCE